MRRPPRPYPLDIRRAAEVLPIGRLAQPAALTGRLARAPTARLAAVALVVRIARIRMEQFTAVQTLASSSLFHLGSPPSYTKHRRQPRSSPPQRGAEEDAKQDPKTEEEDEKMAEEEHGDTLTVAEHLLGRLSDKERTNFTSPAHWEP